MSDELTPGERAEVEKYNSDLAAEIGAMDDTELGILAKRAEVDATKYPDRAALEAAVKEKASADYARGKIELRTAAEEQNRRVDAEDANRPPSAKVLRALNAELAREMPEELRGGSAFSPDSEHPRFGGEYPVDNGRYRVVGSDFILEIKSKRLVQAFAANAGNNWGGKNVKPVE